VDILADPVNQETTGQMLNRLQTDEVLTPTLPIICHSRRPTPAEAILIDDLTAQSPEESPIIPMEIQPLPITDEDLINAYKRRHKSGCNVS
jgi:hypothetical protein